MARNPLRFFVALGVSLALFPFGWLGLVVPSFGSWLDGVFFNDWMHAIGHSAIFMLLGLTLLWACPGLRTRPAIFFCVLLAAAAGQEFFQLLYKQRLLVFDDGRDILTDLAGTSAAFFVGRNVLLAKFPRGS